MALINPDIAYDMHKKGALVTKIAGRFHVRTSVAGKAVREGKENHLSDGAYALFKLGRNTKQIARIQRTNEAVALKRDTLGRCRARSLASPYVAENA